MTRSRRRSRVWLSAARWWLAVLGGGLAGAGLLLLAQIHVAHHLRNEVDSTFFLLRAVARITFMFQGIETQAALVASKVPAHHLAESRRIATALILLGAVLALCAPFCRRRTA